MGTDRKVGDRWSLRLLNSWKDKWEVKACARCGHKRRVKVTYDEYVKVTYELVATPEDRWRRTAEKEISREHLEWKPRWSTFCTACELWYRADDHSRKAADFRLRARKIFEKRGQKCST